MDFESYVAGVGPDGINDVYEIKILICYLLDNTNDLFSAEELNAVFQSCSFVNYFALATAITELKKTGHIAEIQSDGGLRFQLLELGMETSRQLNTILPAALRDKVVKAAMQLLANRKLEKERTASIKKTDDGYVVSCAIHDIGTDLLKVEAFAPDELMAENMKKAFLKDTANVYKGLIAILTGNKRALEEIVSEM